MQTSRFQLGLVATLAVGLGFSLSSSDAIGYPSGAAVSMGSNPVWSVGGDAYSEFVAVMTPPSGRDAIVTDIALTVPNGVGYVYLELESGEVLGRYIVPGSNQSSGGGGVIQSMTSGLRVPGGDTLQIREAAARGLNYTLSGYYAQP